MSALPPKADIGATHRHVCFGPLPEVAKLFDHLVGGDKQSLRHGDAERFGGFQINDQLELGRLLHR
jgi:hypothetical protein